MSHVEGALGWELFSQIFLLEGTPIIHPPHTETDGIMEIGTLQWRARKRTQRSFCLWNVFRLSVKGLPCHHPPLLFCFYSALFEAGSLRIPQNGLQRTVLTQPPGNISVGHHAQFSL